MLCLSIDYVSRNKAYFGCTIGRCANRIANGEFCLDGERFNLSKNREPNHLHGGHKGFGSVSYFVSSVDYWIFCRLFSEVPGYFELLLTGSFLAQRLCLMRFLF